MRILVLDMKNHATENISRQQGTANSPVLRTSETYPPAVSPSSPGTLICHNHLSGDTTPLPERDLQWIPKRRSSRLESTITSIFYE